MTDSEKDFSPGEDGVLRALGELPLHAQDERVAKALGRNARAAYVRATEGEPWPVRVFTGALGRAAVPMVLAGIVGVYLTWAFTAATSVGM